MAWCAGNGHGEDISHNAPIPLDPRCQSVLCEPECWRHIAVMVGCRRYEKYNEKPFPAPFCWESRPDPWNQAAGFLVLVNKTFFFGNIKSFFVLIYVLYQAAVLSSNSCTESQKSIYIQCWNRENVPSLETIIQSYIIIIIISCLVWVCVCGWHYDSTNTNMPLTVTAMSRDTSCLSVLKVQGLGSL